MSIAQSLASFEASQLYSVGIATAALIALVFTRFTANARRNLTVPQELAEFAELRRQADASISDFRMLRRVVDEHTMLSVCDAQGRILEVNAGFCRLSQYSAEELVGRDHRVLKSGHHPPEFWQAVWSQLLQGKSWKGEICNRSKDGGLYWVDATIVPQLNDAGEIEKFISLGFDITAHKQAERSLNLTIRVGRIGMWDWDVRTGKTYFNDLWYTMLGYEPSELPMSFDTWRELVHPADLDHAVAQLQACFEGQSSHYSCEHRLRKKNGEYAWVRAVGEVLERGADGSPSQMIGLHIDVDLLRNALDSAQAASLAKSEFLANMSHEIRTPMTAILGYADLLAGDTEVSSDRKQTMDAVNTIRSNANHLLTVINDILDMSKIEAGRMTIERMDTNPVRVVNEVLALLKARADGKGIQLQSKYVSAIPGHIETDPTRLRQILLNLVGNAIKFTEIGGVTLETSFDPQRNRIVFGVMDTGIGMSEEQLRVIRQFDAFTQADTSMTRRFGGTGLGLRISNALSRLLGGELTIDSEVGRGSCFAVAVDVGDVSNVTMISASHAGNLVSPEDDPPPQQAQPTSNDARPLAGVRVLLAEDGPDNQRLVSFVLRKAGAEVQVAANGRLAVELVEQAAARDELPHVILMDMQMPELDGYGATQILREAGYRLPIVALTAHAMAGDRQKCLDSGCDDYLTKPLDRKLLVEKCLWYAEGV